MQHHVISGFCCGAPLGVIVEQRANGNQSDWEIIADDPPNNVSDVATT
jgi:hypothetical protein